ncbi:MAG: SDR family oxidoreductase, partial [Pseudomonadota bacterium]
MEMKYAVVVGAAGGMGKECVATLMTEGWHVFGLDIRQIEPDTRAHHNGAGALTPLHCDISDSASVEKAFVQIAEHTDRVNALICCSGILRVGPLATMTNEAFDSIFAVNVRGPWLCAKAAVPFLERASQSAYPSRLIFLSSVAAFRPKLDGGAYSATKVALENITRAFAGELASKGILVNAVAPGPVDTPFI